MSSIQRGGLLCLAWLLSVSRALQAEKEGFSNMKLNADNPNLPFTTDTDRVSDGFTSSAAVEPTSPSFPKYIGALAQTDDRYKSYMAYKESAAEQGIAMYGLGDADSEAAKLSLLIKLGKLYMSEMEKAGHSLPGMDKYDKETNPLQKPLILERLQIQYGSLAVQGVSSPSQTFLVYAPIKWNPSGFAIAEGETYSIEVLGSQLGFSPQFWSDGGIRVNAEGYTSYFDGISNCYVALGRCRPHLKKKRRLPLSNWMTLACGIGEFMRPLGDIKEGAESVSRFMPLSESVLQQTIFVVGNSLTFRATHTGELICFANDANSLYWNNKGFLNVTVTRKSWPPNNTTYYRSLKLPACDSAIAVYSLTDSSGGVSSTPMPCNPDGGGAGWKAANIYSRSARYSSGANESFFSDIPDWIKALSTSDG